MEAGSLEAIWYEIRNGTFWTALDEIWHAAEWLFPAAHWRFCQWAHREEA
jgi:hypothetical protein